MAFSKCNLLVAENLKMIVKLNIVIEQLMELLDVILVFYFLYFCLMRKFLVFRLSIIRNHNLPPAEGQVPGLIQIPIKAKGTGDR